MHQHNTIPTTIITIITATTEPAIVPTLESLESSWLLALAVGCPSAHEAHDSENILHGFHISVSPILKPYGLVVKAVYK